MSPAEPTEDVPSDSPDDDDRFVTLDVDISGDLEARWVYDLEKHVVGLLLNRVR